MVPSTVALKAGDVLVSRRFASSITTKIAAILLLSIVISHASSTNPSHSTAQQQQQQQQQPNIVFLIDESTDGRTYRPTFEAIDLVNIRRLFQNNNENNNDNSGPSSITVQFDTHYVTAPVCAASRASIWSGKYPHRIPHLQAKTKLEVNGVWNNFEGLPHDYDNKIHDVLERSAGYDIKISGKTDWVTGGHSLDNRLSAWTMYTNFPYNTTDDQAGFYNEYGMCTGNGVITPHDTPHQGGYYGKDWKAVNETTKWIQERGLEQAAQRNKGEPFTPFFAYQGMNIVHPQYFTSSYWFQKVNHSAVTAPIWKPLSDLHPCDYQATMLKGCLPQNSSEAPSVYSLERRKRIRAIYYAMILEFDSMVGAYLNAIEAVDGLLENTVFVVTSDHGDMQMEHQQFYKHVPYDASSRVPLIISVPPAFVSDNENENEKPPFGAVNPFVIQPTSHVDLFPTIMDLARVPLDKRPEDLHGESLLPFLVPGTAESTTTTKKLAKSRRLLNATKAAAAKVTRMRPFAVNQFHGCDIAMSWFSIIDENHYKYTVYGTGNEHRPQLFDLNADPDENNNLAGKNPRYEPIIRKLDELLRSVVDYEAVANDVARYTHASLGAWVNATSGWKSIVKGLRWRASFNIDANASLAAIEAYLDAPPRVHKCRSEPVWPTLPHNQSSSSDEFIQEKAI